MALKLKQFFLNCPYTNRPAVLKTQQIPSQVIPGDLNITAATSSPHADLTAARLISQEGAAMPRLCLLFS